MTLANRLLPLPLPNAQSRHVQWGKLHGASAGLALAEALAGRSGPACVLASSTAGADRLAQEIAFFAPGVDVRRFPDYETLPYEAISPPQDLLADRLGILHALAASEPIVVVASIDALLNRLPPVAFVLSRAMSFGVGEPFERDAMARQLVDHGYLRVERVTGPGEFAVRGSVVDVFATGAKSPVRIDLFDDEIENLRYFDPSNQLSTGSADSIRLLPAREFPFDTDAIKDFRLRFRGAFHVEPGRCPIYRDISEAVLPAGIEYFLPLFFDKTASLLDYVPEGTLIFETAEASSALDESWALIEHRYDQLYGDIERPLLEPALAFHTPESITASIEAHPRVCFGTHAFDLTDGLAVANADTTQPLRAAPSPARDGILSWLDTESGDRSIIVTSSSGRREIILDMLRGRSISAHAATDWQDCVDTQATVVVAVGEIEGSFRIPAARLTVHNAEAIGMEKPRQRTRRRRPTRDADAIVRELTDLQVGAPVIHEDYGVGRYRGLVTLQVDARPIEFLLLEYADGDKLYVPVHSLHLVSRYTGASPENAPLHKLGSEQWSNAKRKAAQQARDVAAELLHIYAQRAARDGTEMTADDDAYARFALEFPFEETEDQHNAINQVLTDLAARKSMDRIICGDVGFGKTEVALRSAFVVAQSGYQVAVLVPTTLLAQQHYRTFSERFAEWPITVRLLSRFNTGKETTAALEGIANGGVDVVIGTHKLLQRDVKFKRLGLVIVDEEHRFGVKHKERLKHLRADVDMLTMTATPIPRTLNMSLGGLRDLSIIATPPTDRLAVKTFVGEWNDTQIREAVLREIRRGGQVYFVHNRVEDIEKVAAQLERLVPEATVRIGHGQMPESALESVMIDFYHRHFNVLVCTTIVESGIDIPTANTIIIDRADHFGLAQLHQLRGRVGRSHHQAYAYMLAPPLRSLTADARKRLEAIEALDVLGSGFTLATHDLEIRGAGELLGEGQSGQISAVGFTMYNELLARAVTALRAGREPDLENPFEHGPEIEAGLIALIPEEYMPDVHTRLVHYKRIASASSRAALDDLQVELIDRFGLLPQPTKTLFSVTWLKLLAQTVGVLRLQAGPKGGSVEFSRTASIDPALLIDLIAREPTKYRLDGPYKLRFSWMESDESRRIEALEALLRKLGAAEVTAVAA